MIENIFNLFIYTDGDTIEQLGVVVHDVKGNDKEKIAFLRDAVNSDHKLANRFAVKSCLYGASDGVFKYSTYVALTRAGRNFEVFKEIFSAYGASEFPLCCVTPIVNGKPEIDVTINSNILYLSEFEDHPKIGGGRMADYLELYTTPDGFDMPKLLHDDYFDAIKLLFNGRYYVSCMKLIVSFIDTISFIEFGDIQDGFIKWLKSYSSINSLGITESQLWELRNSILHMSNLDSRKVLSGKEKRISFCVASSGYTPDSDLNIQYFNLKDLIDEIAQSLSRWIGTYNENPDKMILFIERYDRIISDSRHAIKSKK
ncbi:MAG: hypothetical protein ACXWF8_10675 [Methylobacter sp.]